MIFSAAEISSIGFSATIFYPLHYFLHVLRKIFTNQQKWKKDVLIVNKSVWLWIMQDCSRLFVTIFLYLFTCTYSLLWCDNTVSHKLPYLCHHCRQNIHCHLLLSFLLLFFYFIFHYFFIYIISLVLRFDDFLLLPSVMIYTVECGHLIMRWCLLHVL